MKTNYFRHNFYSSPHTSDIAPSRSRPLCRTAEPRPARPRPASPWPAPPSPPRLPSRRGTTPNLRDQAPGTPRRWADAQNTQKHGRAAQWGERWTHSVETTSHNHKNQTGNRPRQWDRRGVIVEVMPFRQYKVMLDGSRQLTLRNRKFLRAFTPVSPASPLPSGVGVSHQTSPRTDPYTETRAVSDNSAPLDHPTLLSSSQTATVRPAPRRSARLAGKASRSKP